MNNVFKTWWPGEVSWQTDTSRDTEFTPVEMTSGSEMATIAAPNAER